MYRVGKWANGFPVFGQTSRLINDRLMGFVDGLNK